MAKELLPAGARKRPGGGYEWRFTLPEVPGKRFSVGAPTIRELKEKKAKKEVEIRNGLYKTNGSVTIGQYFDEWIQRKAGTVKPATIFLYQNVFNRHIRPAIGNVKVRQLERRQVLDLQGNMKKRNIIPAANFCIMTINELLKSAIKDEIIIKNVAEGIPRLKDKGHKPARDTVHRELSDEEIQTFFKYSKCSRYDPAFHFMLYTGTRAGECGALEWKDIDWKNRVIHIRRSMTLTQEGKIVLGTSTKTQKSKRDIPMNGRIFRILQEQRNLYISIHGNVFRLEDPVFPSQSGGRTSAQNYDSIIRHILKNADKAGDHITLFSCHAFRDTFASKAIRAGMQPNTLKEILGHASLAMTMDLYAHVSQEDKKRAMDVLDTIAF